MVSEKEFPVSDLARIYEDYRGEWLLLEVIEEEANGSPAKLRLHAHDPDKDALRELMLEQDDWSWKQRFLFVKADPDKPCELKGAESD